MGEEYVQGTAANTLANTCQAPLLLSQHPVLRTAADGLNQVLAQDSFFATYNHGVL